jgi:hypothetical protein
LLLVFYLLLWEDQRLTESHKQQRPYKLNYNPILSMRHKIVFRLKVTCRILVSLVGIMLVSSNVLDGEFCRHNAACSLSRLFVNSYFLVGSVTWYSVQIWLLYMPLRKV